MPAGGRRLLLKRSGARYCVEVKHKPAGVAPLPSVDVLFHSAARYAGPNAVATILTGDDRAAGVVDNEARRRLHHRAGRSDLRGFRNAQSIKRGAVDEILPLQAIARSISIHAH
jgi:two-component system, chemotaxis family, protein-glutamate methylesterase/glutaminase